jgi:mercuric ion binding protein
MRAFFTILCALVFGSQAFAAESTQKACYHVDGMTCAACSVTLKAAVNKLRGIKSVKASVEEKSASIEFDPKQTSSDEIKKAIDSTGYQATENQCHA